MPSSKGTYRKDKIVPAILKAVEQGDAGNSAGSMWVHKQEIYNRVLAATGYENPARMAIVVDVLEAGGLLIKYEQNYRIGDTTPQGTEKVDYSKMIDVVMETVSDGDKGYGSSTTFEKLVNAVATRMEYKNQGTLNVLVQSLIATGRLNGVVTAGRVVQVRMPPPGSGNDWDSKASKLKTEFQKQMEELRQQAQKKMAELEQQANAAKAAAEAAKGKERIVEVVVKNEKGKVNKKTKALFHSEFEKLTKLVQARMNIFLYGPTGSGKTFVCKQLADALGMEFSFVSCTGGLSEAQLMGRLLPIGAGGKFEYVPAEYVERYEKGGLFLFDEIDAMDPNTMLTVNTSLAGNVMAVPNRPAKPYAVKHKDFVCIAASNTIGTGATRQYSGRHKLDASTLDRFQIGKVYIGYDQHVEAVLCPDTELRLRLLCYRAAVEAHELERAVSTRFMEHAYRMVKDHGWTYEDVDHTLFMGWREDEVSKAKHHKKQNEGAMRLKMAMPKVTAEGSEAEEGDVPF